MTDEQISVVAQEVEVPAIAVGFAILRRQAHRLPCTPADLIADLATEAAVGAWRSAL